MTDLHTRCAELFDTCPEAVTNDRDMVLYLPHAHGSAPRWFTLERHDNGNYRIRRRNVAGGFNIKPGQTDAGHFTDVINAGVPFPRHGSVYGWLDDREVTALILPDAQPGQTPCFVITVRTDVEWWPEAGDMCAFGWWFWDNYRVGKIVNLAHVIHAAPDTVYWAGMPDAAGFWRRSSHAIGVRTSLAVSDDGVFPAGVYVLNLDMADGMPMPTLDRLLAAAHRVDLAPLMWQETRMLTATP
jgi:hypothetical protein